MLFEKRFHDGLADGSITLTFRAWPRPQAKAGGCYRTAAGMLEIVSVEKMKVASITERDARRAGFENRAQLVAYLAKKARRELRPDTPIYRVALAYGGPLEDTYRAREADLSDDDATEIRKRLDRMDRRRRRGPWTARTLELIERHPRVAAARLAEKDGRERLAFKTDVRKLERLGLTLSFEVGYEVSPRGRAYLAREPGHLAVGSKNNRRRNLMCGKDYSERYRQRGADSKHRFAALKPARGSSWYGRPSISSPSFV